MTKSCADCLTSDPGLAYERHHIDRNRSNNQPDNLVLLCRPCHRARHRAGCPDPVNIPLDSDQLAALRWLQRHQQVAMSVTFQRLLEKEMWQRFGPDWRIEVRQRTADLAATAA